MTKNVKINEKLFLTNIKKALLLTVKLALSLLGFLSMRMCGAHCTFIFKNSDVRQLFIEIKNINLLGNTE